MSLACFPAVFELIGVHVVIFTDDAFVSIRFLLNIIIPTVSILNFLQVQISYFNFRLALRTTQTPVFHPFLSFSLHVKLGSSSLAWLDWRNLSTWAPFVLIICAWFLSLVLS